MRKLTAIVGLIAVLAATEGTATAVPPTFELDPQADVLLGAGQNCPFDVFFDVTSQNRTTKTFFDQQGNVTMSVTTGVLKGTVTRVETGSSLPLDISGQITLFPRDDGSFLGFVEGPTLVTFVPGQLFYAAGETIFVIPPGGSQKVFVSHLGQTIDICAALAD